ncbi:MAG: hybrid sensor histidine kinase/response regulator [Casimicrobiaceae bacterium]
MSPLAAVPPASLARARCDCVAQLYANWHRTSLSMVLGAGILVAVMWDQVSPLLVGGWIALILANQGWRGALARAWRRARPGMAATARWGRYWAIGSTLAGALWGTAAVVFFPASAPHQALLIVCLFGVVLGGLNLTAVYKPSFYGFVLPALVPLIVRVAFEGDQVHAYTALVMTVVLGFVLAFGHQLNNVLTHSLAIRHENVDLIGELKGQSRAAHEARAAAEAANRAKTQLLAAASHDLRQPLHALGLYTAALVARAREPEWRPLVLSVERVVNALEAQFAQLLDLSRLEAGALNPSHSRVALAPLFARVAADFAPEATAKGIALRLPRTLLAVTSDAALLERVMRNLVANAVRYTKDGGVLIAARRRRDRVVIEVIDTGIGIAAENRERIFEEFYQVRGDDRGRSAGMGLGLAIVRRLAHLLRHDISVLSVPGRGSRFRVVAPRASDTPRTVAAAKPRPRADHAARCAHASLSGALVAVIDDDDGTIDAMDSLFATWGARVAGGADAFAVLDLLGKLQRYPDLVIADLRLADGASGLDAIRTLHAELGFAVPGLIVSGDTAIATEGEVRAAGFSLLPKPVVPALLEAVATALIARAALAASERAA